MASGGRKLLERALRVIPPPPSPSASIHLALSGGIDSSVSALLLREAGWAVTPLTMQCWHDPTANEEGCWERELRAAQATARQLALPDPIHIDLVAEYWTAVFEPFLAGVRDGRIPNADLACNRVIKFGAFLERARSLGAERFATGHYARNGSEGLCAAFDSRKDQSYFLANVEAKALERVLFPLGELLKTEVRQLGEWAGLSATRARSSRGMCFVGKRGMKGFLSQYVEGGSGRVVTTGGEEVARLKDESGLALTIGQRVRIGGCDEALYVVGRRGDDIIVAGRDDKRLRCKAVFCERVEWMREEVVGPVAAKICSTAPRVPARVEKVPDGWVIVFEDVMRRVAPGQAVVLYDGDVVLGAAWPIETRHASRVLSEIVDVPWTDVVDDVQKTAS